MKKLRIMMLMHSDLVPPEDLHDEEDPRMEKYRTEYDVKTALLKLGHDVRVVAVDDDLAPIRRTIEEWKPHIAYNLLEAFAGNGALDYYVVSYLDAVKMPYTGCNPRGLVLARDKALSKKILSYHRIKVPRFRVFRWGRTIQRTQVRKLPYPMVVKSLLEQGSVGIAQASYVSNEDELVERVIQVQEMTGGDAIAEEYIDGRELYVTVIGNKRLQVLPIRELIFQNHDESAPRIATYKVKWDEKYRERHGIDYQFVRNLPAGVADYVPKLCKRIYRILELSSYARMDLRLGTDGKVYVLEANPNAAIANNEDVAFSAEKAGMSYEQFIQRIVNLGLRATSRR
ncbi:MAG: ATP-grasp domain-containing protein [Gammaproteobacteria bacterium]